MIIKSMSRKEPSFNQLVDYMDSGRADERYSIFHNLYSRKPEEVKQEFIKNSRYLNKRSGGNYMYHEVISITRSEQIELDEQKEKLRQIVQHYIHDRAQNNLAFAALHDDKENNLHFHVLISSNEVSSKKRHRLAKHEFDSIKKSLEKKVLEHYPELGQKQLINKPSQEKLSNKGAELKRRTGKMPQREAVREKVKQIFSQAETREQLLEGFDQAGLDFYIRGKHPGVKDRCTGRKYRIGTLGFSEQFEVINQKVTDKLHKDKAQSKQNSENNDQQNHQSKEKASKNKTQDKVKKESDLTAEEKIAQSRKEEIRQQRSKSSDSQGQSTHRKK